MITINYSPIRTYLQGHEITPVLDSELNDLLSFQTSNYMYSTDYLLNKWDGVQRFYSEKTHSFKSGLMYKVLDYFETNHILYTVVGFDNILRLASQGAYQLRAHQIDAVDSAFQFKRGIIQAPPRSGKTKIAGAFLDQSRRFPAIFMCNSIDIASQTLASFKRDIPNVEFGFVGNGVCQLGDITIMTVQSAVMAYEIQYKMRRAAAKVKKDKAKGSNSPGYKRIGSENVLTNEQRLQLREYIESAKTMMYDECHHSQSSIATTVFGKLKSAEIILGLSATPNYGSPEDMLIEATIGHVFYKVTYVELVTAGWLLPAKIFLYKLPKVQIPSLVYRGIYRYAITENEFRNVVIARIAAKLNRMGKNVLIVVDKKTHGNFIHQLYPDAVRVYGEATLKIRNSVKEALNTGVTKCVISTLWDEGVDIPGLHYVINAAGGASPIDTFQRLRSITPNPDDPTKQFGGFIDFMQREKYISRHCRFRRRLYEQEPAFELIDRDISKWDLQKARTSFR